MRLQTPSGEFVSLGVVFACQSYRSPSLLWFGPKSEMKYFVMLTSNSESIQVTKEEYDRQADDLVKRAKFGERNVP